MKRVLIGHRGVGKTELLKRHMIYFSDFLHFDLDQEIEKKHQKKISDIFKLEGEESFRTIEKNVFSNLIQNKNFVISVGAGFKPEDIPVDIDIDVIFVSRRTDSDGRIFLDRPRLNPEVTALEEYAVRFNQRDSAFRNRANFIYHMPEGLITVNNIEKVILSHGYKATDAFFTATTCNLNQGQSYELRTDIFSDATIEKIITENKNTFLVSYRKKTNQYPFTTGWIDWALELGPVPIEIQQSKLIVSNHEDDVKTAIEKFKPYSGLYQKLCPVVQTWSELAIGHTWQSQNPDQRSFLPRTSAISFSIEKRSKWRWYRQLQFSRQKINFIQYRQDIDDQPSLFEYLSLKKQKKFAAVLGEPIHHSKTPITQSQSFELNVLPIPINEAEFEIARPILINMGLVAAAVTSPLKNLAGQLCGKNCAMNSLVYKNKAWIGISTDEFGFEMLIKKISDIHSKSVAVWGGGGILQSIQRALPQAVCYSVQSGKPRGDQQSLKNPDVVIWAAPRKVGVRMPPIEWQPEFIVDLNYAENSLGLEYAQIKNIKYVSGDVMFYAQAEKQLQFWKEHLEE